MKLYKLTNKDWTTRNGCKWGPNVSHPTSGEGGLCSSGYTHWYTHPLLAVFLNPIHANFPDPILWEGEGTIGATDHGLKVGCRDGMTVKIIPLPEVSTEQRVRFAILCTMEVYKEEKWTAWAENWLRGKDRRKKSALVAANAAEAATAADAAADYAAYAAANAAYAAANAAYAAAYAASEATYAASEVAYATATAADYAANAAEAATAADAAANAALAAYAAESTTTIDLIALAEKAMEE